MKIVSEDSRIINELFEYLDNKSIELEKVQVIDRNNSTTRPMGDLGTFLSMGANLTAILTGVGLAIVYINRNFPEWYVVFLPKADEIPMTTDEYEKMSDDGKRAILEHYDIRIKKK